jgi:hypothetical protein
MSPATAVVSRLLAALIGCGVATIIAACVRARALAPIASARVVRPAGIPTGNWRRSGALVLHLIGAASVAVVSVAVVAVAKGDGAAEWLFFGVLATWVGLAVVVATAGRPARGRPRSCRTSSRSGTACRRRT